MTRAFNPAQKFRILVNFDAQVIVDGSLVPAARYAYGTESGTRRYRMLRRDLNCVVMCACGCETWAPLRDIDFDHDNEHASNGPTSVGNGRPLRRDPCHRAKTSAFAAVTGKVTRLRNKHRPFSSAGHDDGRDAQANGHPELGEHRHSKRSLPFRRLTDPKWRKRFDGTIERRTP